MERRRGISRVIAGALEAGPGPVAGSTSKLPALASPLSLAAAQVWAQRSRLAAPLHWRAPGAAESARALVTVGGATLGGDGKTRLSIACVRLLAGLGVRVALVGHGYRARPDHSRVVAGDEPVQLVGDEALVAARRLADLHPRAPVIVAPDRASAVEYAFARADVVVVDGTLQVAPVRASLALLAQSAAAPWGSGLCPPRGDMRASRERLLGHADLPVLVADADADVLLADGQLHPLAALHGDGKLRLGLFTALARPQRIVALLARAGVAPIVHLEAADHGEDPARTANDLARLARRHRLDAWVATDKCATAFTFSAQSYGAPLLTLVPRPEALCAELVARLQDLAPAARSRMCSLGVHACTLSIAAERPAPS